MTTKIAKITENVYSNMLMMCFAMHKHVSSRSSTCLICTIQFYGFISFNIVVLATQIQIFHGTHPEMIEDQVKYLHIKFGTLVHLSQSEQPYDLSAPLL